jgi:hypothetical protein
MRAERWRLSRTAGVRPVKSLSAGEVSGVMSAVAVVARLWFEW